ncbi:MAG: hypothetical protein K1W33_03600 [Clostridia bacterium]|nr:hypothetical protein [Clostridia bacterium]
MNNSRMAKFKFLISIVIIISAVFFIINSTKLLKKPTDTFVVEKGSISYEETGTGYIIRDEYLLEGENFKNGMVQIKYENEKVSKGDTVFRYYSNNEDTLVKKIAELDEQINKAIEENQSMQKPSDMLSIEGQIEDTLDIMHNTNEIRKLDEYKKKIDSYIAKKAQIAGEHSPTGSLVKNLVEERRNLEAELNSNAETITAPESGIVSYRVDGLEGILKCNDFSYLNKSALDSYDVKTGATVPQSNEKGKVVNNFVCYLASCMKTEKADSAKIGDKVTIRLSNTKKIPAEIVYIGQEEDGSKILVFKFKDQIEELIEYRKISFDIIWWEYSGFKISNTAITTDENDLSYINKQSVEFSEKILIKVLRQNETFSIVTNYSDEELKELGFTDEEISDMVDLKLHDEIILH